MSHRPGWFASSHSGAVDVTTGHPYVPSSAPLYGSLCLILRYFASYSDYSGHVTPNISPMQPVLNSSPVRMPWSE